MHYRFDNVLVTLSEALTARINDALVPALRPLEVPDRVVVPPALAAFPVASCNNPGTFFPLVVSVFPRFKKGLGKFSSSARS